MRLEMFVSTLVFALLLSEKAETARILGVFMGQGRSHYTMGSSLLKTLSEAGHEVVLISQHGDHQLENSKYKEIVVLDHDYQHSDTLYDSMKQTNHFPCHVIDRMYQNSKPIIPKVFENSDVKNLLNTTFDLVIVEQTFMDALKVLAWHFKAPLIVFHPLRADTWINSYVGNPSFPSYIPEYPSTFEPGNIYFFERLENAVLYLYNNLYREFRSFKEQNEIMKKYFPNAPELSDIVYNASLILLNSDVSVDQAVPKLPSMIDIRGFNIIPPKPLPADVVKFLNNSVKGVVYVNLDVLTSNYIPEETRNLFVKAFSKLDYDFLWQWDEDKVPDQPPNVMIRRSLPQQDVLANSKIKLFINLGDSLSLMEGVNNGVPQLLLPVLDDQLYNAAAAQPNGYAWSIPFANLNDNDFAWALHELLDNPKYIKESQRRSKIFKQKLITPKKAAVYWVEYVLQTNGAKHLRSAALDYSWYQLFMLDLLAFILAILMLIIFSLKYLITKMYRKCCSCRKNKEKEEDYISVGESEVL